MPATKRLRLAIPNKGRLVEPALALLRDAGLRFEDHHRSLVARAQDQDLDILFVRTADVLEFVRDGVADLGVTGVDLYQEGKSELAILQSLGFGRCRLAVAVPDDSPVRTPIELAGHRVASAHPNVASRYFADLGVPVNMIALSGAVEVAPRLGLADAIVDLVSTGSTLAMNGLRTVGVVLESEAILIEGPSAAEHPPEDRGRLQLMLSAVVAARARKYVMMNAPASAASILEGLLPGLASPSIVPLAQEGMIALHSVVRADDVWELLPRLKAAGASGILVLPIEKVVA